MIAKHLKVLRDRRADRVEAANDRLKALRAVFKWAVSNDHAVSNPARDVEPLKNASGGFHTWTVEEVRQFEERHPIGTKARLALALLLYLGPRRSDVVQFGGQHINGSTFTFTQHKGRKHKIVTLALPILPELREVLERTSLGEPTFLTTNFDRPFTANGFGNWFRKRCDEAGLLRCSAHGLRKAGATIAAENGATTHQLMAIYGWTTVKQAERYTRRARQRRLAEDAMMLLKPRDAVFAGAGKAGAVPRTRVGRD